MKRYINLFAVGAGLGLILAACGGAGTVTTLDGTTSGGTLSGGKSLLIYSGRSEELVAPLIDAFEAASGIEVDVRYGSSTEMAATLAAEGESSRADIFYAQDPSTIGSVTNLLEPLPETVLASVPERFRDPAGLWTGITVRSRVLAYNPELVAEEELPATFHDLTDPRWSGRVGLAPTNGSFLTFVAAMMVLEGEEATLGWLEGMAANDPVEFDGNSPIAAAVDAGDVDLGLINHYYLLRLAAEQGGTTAVNYFWPEPSAASYVMPSGAAILASAPNPSGAAAFLSFLLAPEQQAYFAESIFEYPVVAGAPAPAGAPPLDTLVSPEITLSDLAESFDRATDLITESGLL